MLQAVVVRPGSIEVRDVPVPSVQGSMVLIEVRNIGICGSDMHVFHGEHIYKEYPVILGHEVSGEVRETGDGVTGIESGDRVIVRPQVTCGNCYNCRHGNYNICSDLKVVGFHVPGAAGEYLLVPQENVIPIPGTMSFEEGAMVEPLAVAVHALRKCGDVGGKKVLVLGAGPIGNLVAQVARAKGAEAVMITDRSRFKLEKASDCGVTYPVNILTDNIEKTIVSEFGPDKADVILECVGIEDTVEQAIELARGGTDIIIVGVPGEKFHLDISLVQNLELKLIGTLMYKEEDFGDAIRFIDEDRVELKKLVTDRFPFSEYAEAYRYIDDKGDCTMKVQIYFEGKE